ncbi:hypothetical protein ACFPIJ_38985 [Dactylosporangium cerinum]|uniref:Uncharacterized protein n=1 Tax=Dactylosporangium cerinum TaxID=1434730 RepID=A0ABV9W9E3_9ACTN
MSAPSAADRTAAALRWLRWLGSPTARPAPAPTRLPRPRPAPAYELLN